MFESAARASVARTLESIAAKIRASKTSAATLAACPAAASNVFDCISDEDNATEEPPTSAALKQASKRLDESRNHPLPDASEAPKRDVQPPNAHANPEAPHAIAPNNPPGPKLQRSSWAAQLENVAKKTSRLLENAAESEENPHFNDFDNAVENGAPGFEMDEHADLPQKRAVKFVKTSLSLLFALVLVGVLYCSVRLKWPVSYSFYWTIVTALTVGYGDAPTCNVLVNTTDDDGAPDGLSLSGCGYRSIRDSDGDMVFVMLYSTATVAVALSMLTEFIESLDLKQRKREARAQRVLLEAFFDGEKKIEEAKSKAVMISM